MQITLKSARVNSLLTQKEACKQLAISQQTLSNWENGKSFPNIMQIKKIEKLYNVDFGDILFLPADTIK